MTAYLLRVALSTGGTVVYDVAGTSVGQAVERAANLVETVCNAVSGDLYDRATGGLVASVYGPTPVYLVTHDLPQTGRVGRTGDDEGRCSPA